jgi:hypothetical protein
MFVKAPMADKCRFVHIFQKNIFGSIGKNHNGFPGNAEWFCHLLSRKIFLKQAICREREKKKHL